MKSSSVNSVSRYFIAKKIDNDQLFSPAAAAENTVVILHESERRRLYEKIWFRDCLLQGIGKRSIIHFVE
jgi:hypothetical protein